MKTIYKYQLNAISMVTEIPIPRKAKVLKCGLQNNQVFIWAMVQTDNEDEIRSFEVCPTGEEVDVKAKNHIGTIFQDELVWHIFEI
tara:strand:+ start:260 stop:517 length:258 start_codon:yes stop_codon:yes gene_type:complete